MRAIYPGPDFLPDDSLALRRQEQTIGAPLAVLLNGLLAATVPAAAPM
jgi:hypothetical protein